MAKQCVKCGYTRQVTDSGPEYECPKCGIIYAKAEAALEERLRKARESEQRATQLDNVTAANQLAVSTASPQLPIEAATAIDAVELTTECPYCAEKISPKAKKCKHCGEILDATMRELEVIKSMKQNVYMNAGGGGGAAVAAMPVSKAKFPHLPHLIMTLLTMGTWVIIWILHYLFRDKTHYA